MFARTQRLLHPRVIKRPLSYAPYRRSRLRTFFVVATGLSIGLYGAYYMWWPKHTFPSPVAKILRKGLWAESDRGENDFQLALKHYLEALQECQEMGVAKTSDEYTGIQLKVAEMMERMNMMEDAAMVYNEIATMYLTVLTGKTGMDHIERRRMIQKDLRIAIKLAQLNSNNPHLAKAILITHLIIAQDEAKKKLGNRTVSDVFSKASEQITLRERDVSIDTSITKCPEVWEPFADEFFAAMDMLSATCLVIGDLDLATQIKIETIQGMLLADIEANKFLLSQCNLGSLLYFQAEQFESKEIQMRKKYPALSTNDGEEPTWDENMSEKEKAEFKESVSGKQQSIKSAIEAYNSVLEYGKTAAGNLKEDSQRSLSEIIALATYGLGVVHLHTSDYDKSERLLRESRVRAKSSGYSELITAIERELEKLFKERKLVRSGETLEKDGKDRIDLDIHIKG